MTNSQDVKPQCKYTRETDGIDHIRIHYHGRTELGRGLSEFSKRPVHTRYGTFLTLVGYSAFLRYGCIDAEYFQNIDGAEACRAASVYKPVYNPWYMKDYKNALYRRAVKDSEDLRIMLLESTLPLVVYETANDFIAQHYTKVRSKLQRQYNMRETASA